MNSPKLTTTSDGKWLIACTESGAMKFWPTSPLAKEATVTYDKGGPWFSAFFASSPDKPFASRPAKELPEAWISVLNSIPYPASEVTGIIGRPGGTVVFSPGGDIVCWNLAEAPTSNELARPITKAKADAGSVLLRFGTGEAYFSPIAERIESGGGNRIVLRFVWEEKVLADYAITGACESLSQLSAVANDDGRFVVVSTGRPPAKMLVTM